MTGRKILIVEDESIVRLHLRRIIEAMGHQLVGLASSADEALACAAADQPELVLMDINLQGERDGVDTARELVDLYGCAVVFATAFADDDTIRRTEEAGAVGYVLKPFGERAVRAALATALREHDRMRSVLAHERSLEGIIGSLGEAVLLVDQEMRITFHNPRAERLAWSTGQNLTGQHVMDVLKPATDDETLFRDAVESGIKNLEASLLPTVALQNSDGQEILANGSIEPVEGSGGTSFVISLRDLTQRWFGQERRPSGALGGGRLLIYSHDTFGLGHLRRSLNLSRALVDSIPDLSILLVTGSAVAHRFPLPPRVDYVKLPAVRKMAAGQYSPRSLDMPDDDVLAFRANLLLRTARDFHPDLMLVDHSPAGMRGELKPTLSWLREHRQACTTILGLRDIIDHPDTVTSSWHRKGIYRLIEDSYDKIVVYGSSSFFDPTVAYDFPDSLVPRVRFLGHVVEDSPSQAPPRMESRSGPHIVVTTGGGDGAVDQVAGGFLEMLEQGILGRNVSATVLPGPLVEPDSLAALTRSAPVTGARILEFVDSTSPFMADADLVICTAGYNTTVQVLRYGKRALMVPRVMHRREQLLRATKLSDLGLVNMLTPDQVTPKRLAAEIRLMLDNPREPLAEARAKGVFDFEGATHLAEYCASLLRARKTTTEATHD